MNIDKLNWIAIATIGIGVLTGCSERQKEQTGLSVQKATHHKISGVRHLSSCPSTAPNGVDRIDPVNTEEIEEGSVNLTRSFVSPEIGASLVSVAVDTLTNAISASLQDADKNLNGSFIASGVSQGGPEQLVGRGIKQSSNKSCFIVMRGVSGELNIEVSTDGLPKNTLKALGLSDQPAFYAEFEGTEQDGQRVVTVRHIHYAQSSAKWNGSNEKAVTVGLNLAVSKFEGKEDIKANEVYLFDLGRLQIGASYTHSFPISQSSAKTAKGVYNIFAVVNEAEKSSVALKALAQAFETNKDDLADAIKPKGDE